MRFSFKLIASLLCGVTLLYLGVIYLAPGFAYGCIQKLERSLSSLTTKNVQVGQFEISYMEGGSGETLVMLHGFGANKDHWTRTSRHLVKHFHLVIPDLPGFGESSRHGNQVYAIRHQADRMAAFLDTLEIESCIIAGNSMGGAIAAEIAKRFPGRVKMLWLIAPAGVLSADIPEAWEYLEQGINPLLVENPGDFQRLLEVTFVKTPYLPNWAKRYLTDRAVLHRPSLDRIFGDLISHGFSLERTLRKSIIPTLILWGAEDRILDVSGAHILGKIIPHAQVLIMQETGHVPMLEYPELTARHWLTFHDKTKSD